MPAKAGLRHREDIVDVRLVAEPWDDADQYRRLDDTRAEVVAAGAVISWLLHVAAHRRRRARLSQVPLLEPMSVSRHLNRLSARTTSKRACRPAVHWRLHLIADSISKGQAKHNYWV